MENIIDYGEWSCPKSWDELDLKTFQEIERFYGEKGDDDREFDVRDVLSILCHKTEDEVNSLPIEFSEKIVNGLSWMAKEPQYQEPTNKMKINGEEYIVNIQEKLKTGEFVAVDTVMKNDKHNYAAILAILCRKQGEVYDSKFENEVLPSRIELFEKIPMMDAMRVISFFLTLWLTLGSHIQLSSKVREALDLTQKNIEISRQNGRLSALSTILLKRKLKKLRKSIPHI